jgi:hypothetical protein
LPKARRATRVESVRYAPIEDRTLHRIKRHLIGVDVACELEGGRHDDLVELVRTVALADDVHRGVLAKDGHVQEGRECHEANS